MRTFAVQLLKEEDELLVTVAETWGGDNAAIPSVWCSKVRSVGGTGVEDLFAYITGLQREVEELRSERARLWSDLNCYSNIALANKFHKMEETLRMIRIALRQETTR